MANPHTAEEMASWLLDDSTLECPENGDEYASPKKRRANTLEILHSQADEPAISPLNLPLPFETPPYLSGKYPQRSRVDKFSQRSPGKVPKRAATTRIRKDRSQRRTSTNLKRQLSLDPLKFHPTNSYKVTTPVALTVVDGNVRNRVTEGPSTPSIGEGCANGEAINGKLVAMLAATDALKPTPQRTNSSSSRLTRMVPSKVLAKVSNAWDRFNPKAPSQEKESQYKSAFDDEGTRLDTHGVDPPPVSPDNMSLISNIEIRLNEGDNLNKRKVQRIVGGRVNRKPLADDGKSLRSGKPVEDPFSERDRWHTPTTFEHRLMAVPEKEEGGLLALSRSPFESEKEFDNNIEDRFLNSTPVGSSTPRMIVEQASTSSDECISATDSMSPSRMRLVTKLSYPPLMFDKETPVPDNRSRPDVGNPSEGAVADLISQSRRAWEQSTTGFTSFGIKRTKKHPSPSKEVLEDLERELRQYAHDRASGAGGDYPDEINVGCIDESPSLRQCERNRLSLTRLAIANIDELANPAYDGGHHGRGSSASMIRYSSQSKVKLHRDVRFAPSYRPAGSPPHDVDELH
ncbi:hypothetical protein FLAG1_03207 [Fusarium langsethiae]|uniref:Uncharacterized protein n=1 Tax=Fusarium langsethiae TaxID=179993 RepID=A0A0M9F103_FUSLA|nr:hypothetical protein FLAG1_03207 [Fusarium langsethiae]GKU01078.1 unnamed protein product [Fusarium langsethiae]GKU13633.1 unnamed protein product [Fusarium langsethiae]